MADSIARAAEGFQTGLISTDECEFLGPAPSFDLEFAPHRSCQIERTFYIYELQDWVIVGELCTAANPMKVDSPAYVLGAANVNRLVRIG